MMLALAIFGLVTLAGAAAAVSLRNLVHCALALVVAFAGLAAMYLALNAQFVGFAQLLVYVGAVSILIVFALLLTRGGGKVEGRVFSGGWLSGLAVALGTFAVLARAIWKSRLGADSSAPPASITVKQIGDKLLTDYVLPLEIIGLLLTAALIGAAIIALQERKKP
jgi:NADH:ubiquinone oxidoreductase subunit 6 (subunit J)